jgi:ribulose-bisphosphate carboxylase large chain
MVSPMLLGLPFFNELSADSGSPCSPIPRSGGPSGSPPQALLGKLFPLFGADAVIYPNYGGRFSYSPEVCVGIARALRSPDAAMKPALPGAGRGHQDRESARRARVLRRRHDAPGRRQPA